MRLRTALLGATMLAAPLYFTSAAKAQPIDGLYVGAGAGANYRQDQDLRGIVLPGAAGQPVTTTIPNGATRFRSDLGFVALGSVGYGLGNGLRFELEGSYRQNKLTKLEGSPVPTAAGGQAETYAAMVNAVYDIDIAPFTGIDWIYPYVGVGAGYAWNKLHSGHYYSAPIFYAQSNDTDGNFAAQGFVGLSFPISAVPGLSLTAEYRFFTQLGDTSYNGYIQSGRTFTAQRIKLGDSYNHSGLVGLRYAFDVAPPPPPPAPAPVPVAAPARSYLVFFDWDRANLTERARQIIREAADNSTRVQYTTIEVNGYTDTSGTPRYNQGLSIRRAQAVAAELVRDGVPRQAISIQGFGETHLLVPTGPGVREPQNRRVEIIIR
jgi:OOP family OmpA-OmpF porin